MSDRSPAGRAGYEDGLAGKGMNPDAAGSVGGKLTSEQRDYQVGWLDGRQDGGHGDMSFGGGLAETAGESG